MYFENTQTEIYKLPRLKAINTIIAGPEVTTRNNAANCNNVVALNICTSLIFIILNVLLVKVINHFTKLTYNFYIF